MAQTHKTDPYDRLDESYAPSLPRFQSGDRVAGTVLSIDRRTGEFGVYPILTLEVERASFADHPDVAVGEPYAWHVLHTVAQRRLAELQVKPGERVAAKYDGLRDSTTGRGQYHRWTIASDRPQQEFAWAEFGDTDEPPEPDIPTSGPNEDDRIPF